MEKPNKYFVWGFLSIFIPIVLYIFAPRPETRVLSENISVGQAPIQSEQTETPIISGPTASPSATFTPIKSGQAKAPIPIKSGPVPTPASSAEVNGMIERFAAQYSVDPNIMRHLAICESGFNSSAVSGAYVGLYQFGTITWKNLREEIGEDLNLNLRFSAEEATQTAAYALSLGKRGIWPNCAP